MIILIFIAFISLGLPDSLLGVAWPGIRATFELPLDAIGPLLVFGTAGYMTSSFFAGPLIRRFGIGELLALSCFATSATLLIYALTPVWTLFVVAAVIGGLGAGAIDAGVNTYVAQNYGERVMHWLHACFGIGVTSGPLIMTFALAQTGRWEPGYFAVCAAQLLLAALFFKTRRGWQSMPLRRSASDTPEAGISISLGHPASLASALIFFLYTGVEVCLGLWMFTLLIESRHVATETAGFITAAYWGMFTLGRVMAGVFVTRLSNPVLIHAGLGGALVGTLMIIPSAGLAINVIGVLLAGFSIAPIFPALTSDTAARVGLQHESNTIGMQMGAAGFGAALLPAVAGLLAERQGLEVLPLFVTGTVIVLWAGYGVIRKLSNRDSIAPSDHQDSIS